MANRTDPGAMSVHGTNPQNLVEKILRNRIYSANYWKEHCFGLTAASLVDKAVKLRSFGGTFGGNKQPTPFICLILKMLQIQPEKEIIIEYIQNQDYKYVRLLGAFYLRLVGKPREIYEYLEPLYNDYRKVRERVDVGYKVTHVDEFIENLLTGDYSCDISLPYLPKRALLEEAEGLPRRVSGLEDELDESSDEERQSPTRRSRSPSSERDKFGRDARNRSPSPRRRGGDSPRRRRDDSPRRSPSPRRRDDSPRRRDDSPRRRDDDRKRGRN